ATSSGVTTSTGGTTTSTSGTGSTTTATTPLNPIAQKLQGKPLGSRLEKMLPKDMTLNTASSGFRNQGQFIAAVHVSQNLGIPFADLKAAMLGSKAPTSGTSTTGGSSTTTGSTTTTSSTPLSLGQAIHKLRPSADSSTEAAHAQSQATTDLSATSTST